MTEGIDWLANVTIETDPEPLPTIVGGGRTAVPVPESFVHAVRHSYTLLNDGKGAEAVQRIMVPVDRAGMKWQDQTRTTKDAEGNESKVVTKWQQHANVTQAISLIRRAAEQEGLGARVVVDRTEGDDGSKALKVTKGAVRIRFVGMKRKQRKTTEAPAATASE